MKTSRVNAIVAVALMVIAAAGAAAWKPTAHLADTRPRVDLEAMFPKQLDGWSVDTRMPAQLVSPDTQAFLDKIYNQTLSRTYVNGKGERIMLSVAYGGDQSDATRAHRPEVCYPAQGFQVLSSDIGVLTTGQLNLRVRRLVAKQGGRIEPITYWITVGEKATITGTEQKLAQLFYSSRGVIPDGMLVRVSSINPDTAAGFALQDSFVDSLAQAVAPGLRAQTFGIADQ